MPDERMGDNYTMRVFLMAIQDIVGENGLKSVLNYTHLEKYINNFPPNNDDIAIPREDFSKLLNSLSEIFGEKGSRSLKLGVGREFGRKGVEGRTAVAIAIRASTRFLPEKKRARFVLNELAKEFERKFPSPVSERFQLIEEGDCLLYIDRDYYGSEGITSGIPICDVYSGLLQYLAEWITGHPYKVEEIECRAMGNPSDVFRISRVKSED